MNEIIKISGRDLAAKEWQGLRVVTLKDIDFVHERPEGTARKRFNDNKERFVEGEDFFEIKQPSEIRTLGITRPQGGTPSSLTLVTESGYLMLVKSFTDDLAWKVQRDLVNTYFRARAAVADFSHLSPQLQTLISLETEQRRQAALLEAVEQKVDGVRDLVALSPNGWREECSKMIARIARAMGGAEHIRDANAEAYALVNARARVDLDRRLTNKRQRMAEEGVSKTKRERLNKKDVIADDPKLIEIYIKVVREMAIKYGAA